MNNEEMMELMNKVRVLIVGSIKVGVKSVANSMCSGEVTQKIKIINSSMFSIWQTCNGSKSNQPMNHSRGKELR